MKLADEASYCRTKLLVTGANGFVGRNVVSEVLMNSSPVEVDNSKPSARENCSLYQYPYSHVVALDICSSDSIAECFGFSSRVLPLQLDLSLATNDSSQENTALISILNEVDCIIHAAGVVDTRENVGTKDILQKVNTDLPEKLLTLAKQCGVRRFIHLSSAAACMEKVQSPWYLTIFNNSLLSQLSMSSYGKSKKLSEEKVLSNHSSGRGSSTDVVVLRPHVVWGRGDPLATEIMLKWKCGIQPIIGDVDCPVVSVHVRTLSRLILLADKGLMNDNDKRLSGRIINIGEEFHTLKDLHKMIMLSSGEGRYSKSPIAVGGSYLCGCPVRLLSIPTVFSILIIILVQTIDWLLGHSSKSTYFRLITPNNYAYTTKGILSNDLFIESFRRDCLFLFQVAEETEALPNHASRQDEYATDRYEKWLNDYASNIPGSYPDALDRLSELDDEAKFKLVGRHSVSDEWTLGPISLRNRVIKAATFESMCDKNGVPNEILVDFHAKVVKGGAAMTIVAYASVSYDGRSFPTQICLKDCAANYKLHSYHEDTIARLRQLTERVHFYGGKACIQITHAGAFADPSTNIMDPSAPARAPSAIFNPLTMKYSASLDKDLAELQRIEDDFAEAVRASIAAGFDAVELHLGHGYLLSQFLSRRTNPRYANNPSRRLEFPLRVLKRMVAEAAGKLAVLVKFNISELKEEDLPLSDARFFARAFVDAGADLLVPSGGHVMTNGLHMLRGGAPVQEMARAQSNFLKRSILQWLGPWLVRKEPYREAFFLERAISVCLGAGIPLSKVCLIGGVHDVKTLLRATGNGKLLYQEPNMMLHGYGFAAVQMGRTLLADPRFCLKIGIINKQIENGADDQSKGATALIGNHSQSFVHQKLNVCDNSNRCIVDATMALKPLCCSKYQDNDW